MQLKKTSRLPRKLWYFCIALAVGCSQVEIRRSSPREEPVSPAQLTLTGADGTRYEGEPLIIQVVESADPPVQASLAATAANGATWTALFGLSIEMLASRSMTIEVQRRPLRVGAGVVTHGSGDHPTPVREGTIRLQLGTGQSVSGSATADEQKASATFVGRYGLSCWVRPETLGLRPNGSGPSGVVERVEDESFQSEFCRRVAHLR